MDTKEELSISQIIERQRDLEAAARKRFPWDPSECTLYMDISPRQLLFACLTCNPTNAICYACGLRCHADHNIVELYSKRGFRCDCGTSRISGTRCSLRRTENDEWANPHMNYKQNFEGRFCVCSESVDDSSYGEGAMFQCLVGTQCGEDWFHARCIVGISREEELARQIADENKGEANISAIDEVNIKDPSSEVAEDPEDDDEIGDEEMDDEDSGDELDTVFPELPAGFEAVICPACSKDVPQLLDSPAVITIVNGFVFLNESYGTIVKQSPELSNMLHEFPFLDGQESTYRPERDDDNTTLLEAGERALQDLPHEAVMNGLAKFNKLQENLVDYLRDIAADGHAVTKEDVEKFFNSQK